MVQPVSPQFSSMSSSSASSSPGPPQKPENNGHEGEESGSVNRVEDVIDLCSDNDSDFAKSSAKSLNGFGSDIDSGDEDGSSELKVVAELRKVQKAFSAKLNKLERKVKERRQKELEPNNGTSEQPRQQESSCGSGVQLSSTSVSKTKPTISERELKRKLKMVTAELARSRMEQVKKIRRSTIREQMFIDVPEFPMEYYNQIPNEILEYQGGKPEDWFQIFNRHLEHLEDDNQPEYPKWIETRTTEFLPEVLKVMATVWNKSASTASQLSSSDLLNFRLVNKTWKRSVDKVMHEQCCLDGTSPLVSTILRSSDYKRAAKLALGLGKKSPTAHPFPSRSFIVSTHHLANCEFTKLFNGAIELLLQFHGNDVQHFGYHWHDGDSRTFFDATTPSRLNSWMTLGSWLAKMPNLKTLQIYLPRLADVQISIEDAAFAVTNPFPSFPKLLVFESRHVPDFLMESVLSHNSTIEKLGCFQLSGESHPKWENTHGQLKKLSEFSMNVLKNSHILPLWQVNWPLRKLTLSTCRIYEELIDLGSLFTTLQSFQKTLQELDLELWVKRPKKTVRLELPHLKKLNLFLKEESKQEKISYDFLLSLNQLEILKLVFERETDTVGEVVQVIQLQGYLNRLYKSNVWKLFPCLKMVDATAVYGDGCSRKFQYLRDELPK